MNERTRFIITDEKKCIGCRACTSTCPEGSIRLSEESGRRNIQFPGICTLDCELCALACPERAITFIFRGDENISANRDGNIYLNTAEKSELSSNRIISLELMPCRKCGATFATIKEIEKVRKTISEKVPLFFGKGSWMELCPGCRKTTFREKEAEMLLKIRHF